MFQQGEEEEEADIAQSPTSARNLVGDVGGKVAVVFLLLLILWAMQGRASGASLFGDKSGAATVTGRKFVNSVESLGDVIDMLTSVGLEEHFADLRNNGMTNLVCQRFRFI